MRRLSKVTNRAGGPLYSLLPKRGSQLKKSFCRLEYSKRLMLLPKRSTSSIFHKDIMLLPCTSKSTSVWSLCKRTKDLPLFLKFMQEFKRSCSVPQVHKYADCNLPLIHLLSQAMLIIGLYLSNSPTDSGDDFLGLHVRSNLFQTSTICLLSHQQQASEMSDLSLTKAWILQNV